MSRSSQAWPTSLMGTLSSWAILRARGQEILPSFAFSLTFSFTISDAQLKGINSHKIIFAKCKWYFYNFIIAYLFFYSPLWQRGARGDFWIITNPISFQQSHLDFQRSPCPKTSKLLFPYLPYNRLLLCPFLFPQRNNVDCHQSQ